jgi:hypothetical protein
MTVDRFSMTNILEIKRERLFAAMTREESDASLARAGAQGRYLPSAPVGPRAMSPSSCACRAL